MKSHLNSSPCSATLAARSCARFSPTSRTPAAARPARSSERTYLVAASSSIAPGSGRRDAPRSRSPRAAQPGSRGRAQGSMSIGSTIARPSRALIKTRAPCAASADSGPDTPSRKPRHSRLASCSRGFAPVGEEALVADRAQADVMHPIDARCQQALTCQRLQVDRRAAAVYRARDDRARARAIRRTGKRGVDLRTDLIAAGSGTGTDDRCDLFLGVQLVHNPHPLLQHPRRQAPPARVDHCGTALLPSATGRQSAVSTIAPMPATEVAWPSAWTGGWAGVESSAAMSVAATSASARMRRTVVPYVRLIHSVASESALRELERHRALARPGLEILIEVNVARERGKPGIAPEQLDSYIERATVPVAGLMCMPPLASTQRTAAAGSPRCASWPALAAWSGCRWAPPRTSPSRLRRAPL